MLCPVFPYFRKQQKIISTLEMGTNPAPPKKGSWAVVLGVTNFSLLQTAPEQISALHSGRTGEEWGGI